mmetsp:Transcript_5258/g.13355  ORF Transcript_5258/g.13355 Transcript_5258/m.13355 type:complete len:207 (-) Transcript_5258:48-668(-)
MVLEAKRREWERSLTIELMARERKRGANASPPPTPPPSSARTCPLGLGWKNPAPSRPSMVLKLILEAGDSCQAGSELSRSACMSVSLCRRVSRGVELPGAHVCIPSLGLARACSFLPPLRLVRRGKGSLSACGAVRAAVTSPGMGFSSMEISQMPAIWLTSSGSSLISFPSSDSSYRMPRATPFQIRVMFKRVQGGCRRQVRQAQQ